MIKYAQGNILQAEAEALVNTVNCVGVMGKGIALQFKKAFPDNNATYEKACRYDQLQPGKLLIFPTGSMVNPKYIINFPTKRHWKGKSHYEYIETGLKALVDEVRLQGIHSVAIPPLGCGLGGLDWNRVRLMIEKAFSSVSDVNILLYEPKGSPQAKDMPVHTSRPHLTVPRALFIKLMQQYCRLAYRLTLLEIQKLAYFLQESGQPLRLKYIKHIYGPYAHNLNKVLEIMEGHFTRGYGDTQKPDVEITLLDGAPQEAEAFLAEYQTEKQRLERVENLVDGFETPYGMELLSSVHWLVVHDHIPPTDEAVCQAMKQWNERKADLFRQDHIKVALKRLAESRWIEVDFKEN
jgi:O-acetyl-ADP-ribose deacetylase (regulator of RNase III)